MENLAISYQEENVARGTLALNTQVLKVGNHRGSSRVWLDNDNMLKQSGFFPGTLYESRYCGDLKQIVLTIASEGRKVSKKGSKSIIDLSSKKVGFALGKNCRQVTVIYSNNEILIKRDCPL